jgi:aminocarboxymuconate-semialdehyde decarboxylase
MFDAHVHVIAPGDWPQPPPSAVGEFRDVDRILEQTRADRVLLAPWVALLGIDDERQNDALAGLVSDRAAVLGAGAPEDPEALRRAVDRGLAGVEVTAKAGDAYLGDERFAPFWTAAEETGALVFIHPSTRGFSGPPDHYLWNTVGNPVETTVTAAHLVMAGVMERHPAVKVLLAHGGGAVPALRGRLRHAHEHLAAARTALREPVEDSLRRFHFDSVTHDPAVLRELVAFAGADRVLAGSDHPFDMGDPDPAATIRAAGLGADAEAAILSGNAERLVA